MVTPLGLSDKYIWLQPVFLVLASASYLLSLAILVWPLLRKENRAALARHLRHPAELVRKLQSIHFIYIGFFLVLIGLIFLSIGMYGLRKNEGTKERNYSTIALPSGVGILPVEGVPRKSTYRLSNNSLSIREQPIIRARDGAFIPPDPRNSDFSIYLRWLAAGYKPDPVEAVLAPSYAPRSSADAEKEIALVDQISQAITDCQLTMMESIQNVMSSWPQAIASKNAARLEFTSDSFLKSYQYKMSKLDDIMNSHPQYLRNDISEIIPPLINKGAEISDRLTKARAKTHALSMAIDVKEYAKLETDVRAEVQRTVGSYFSELADEVEMNRMAMDNCLQALEERREQLSKAASK